MYYRAYMFITRKGVYILNIIVNRCNLSKHYLGDQTIKQNNSKHNISFYYTISVQQTDT